MHGENIKVIKDIKTHVMSITQMKLATQNSSFYQNILLKPIISTLSEENRDIKNTSLIFDLSRAGRTDQSQLNHIIELLNQLKASQSDQTVLVNNNTVVRQQILNELKNELLKVQNKLDKGQVQKLSVISSNNFDEDTLNDLLKSLSEESKKKSALKSEEERLSFRANQLKKLTFVNNIIKSRTKIIDSRRDYKELVYSQTKSQPIEQISTQESPIYLKKQSLKSQADKKQISHIIDQNKDILNKISAKQRSLADFGVPKKEITRTYKQKDIVSQETSDLQTLVYNLKTEKTLLKDKKIVHVIKKYLENQPLNVLKSYINKTQIDKTEKTSATESKVYFNKFEKKEVHFKARASHIDYLTSKLEKYTQREFINNLISNTRSLIQQNVKNTFVKTENNLSLKAIKLQNLNKNFDYKYQIPYTHVYDKFAQTKDEELTYLTKQVNKIETESTINRDKINKIEHENLVKKSVKIYQKIQDKHKIFDTFQEDRKVFSKRIKEVTSFRKLVNNKKLIENIENISKNIDKRLIYSDKVKNIISKIINLKQEHEVEKITPKFYQEIHNKLQKSSLKISENIKQSKVLEQVSLSKNLLYLNKNINLKDVTKDVVDKFKEKSVSIDKYAETINKIKTSQKNQEISQKMVTKKLRNQDIKVYKNVYKHFLDYVNKNVSKTENIVSEKEYNENKNEKIIHNYIKFNKKIFSKNYKETSDERDVYKSKELILHKKGIIDKKTLQTKIKESVSEKLTKTLNIVTPQIVKQKFIEKLGLISTKKLAKDVIKPTKILEEIIKNKSRKSKFISEKTSITLPPRIKKLKSIQVEHEDLHRKIQETEKIYFNNLEESSGKQLSTTEKVTLYKESSTPRDSASSMVYKIPLNIKKIYDKIQKKETKSTKSSQGAKPDAKFQKAPYTAQPQQATDVHGGKMPKILKEEDVLKIISSYLQDLNLSTLSDKVMERVEKELEIQKRMSGII